jgi:phage shock protein PspC (stress-responsive transcriptional regulator)
MRNDFEGLANKFLTKESLIKLLHCGTKVLAEIGFVTIIAIIENVCVPK